MSTTTFNQTTIERIRRNIALGSIEWLTRAIRALDTWRRRQQSRSQFAGIDHRILRDAGISEARVFIEVNKPFWEA